MIAELVTYVLCITALTLLFVLGRPRSKGLTRTHALRSADVAKAVRSRREGNRRRYDA